MIKLMNRIRAIFFAITAIVVIGTGSVEAACNMADREEIEIVKVKLGGSADLSEKKYGKIYVPTKWGGKLKLTGNSVKLYYTDGADLDCDTVESIYDGDLEDKLVATLNGNEYTVPENKHKWYYMVVSSTSDVAIQSKFTQKGEAATTPWNGWYWPRLDSQNPNLYDTSGNYTPLKKYDTVYNTYTTSEESGNWYGGDVWEGHCRGWAIASVSIDQPLETTVPDIGYPRADVDFNQDEMEGLYIELAEGADIDLTTLLAPGNVEQPTDAKNEPIDMYARHLHLALRSYIKEDEECLVGNLRSAVADSDLFDEVWNHAVYSYESTMEEYGDAANEKVIKISTDIKSNSDSEGGTPPSDGDFRPDNYVYVLEYDDDGEISISSDQQNWLSCSAYPPCNLFFITSASLGIGEHCSITKENVDALYGENE